MVGDILAWIFGAAAVMILVTAGQRRRARREEYHRELIREFAGEENDPGQNEGKNDFSQGTE